MMKTMLSQKHLKFVTDFIDMYSCRFCGHTVSKTKMKKNENRRENKIHG